LSKAKTIDDVLVSINRSGAPVRADLDPVTERIQIRLLKSGANYAIGETGGTVATDLGLRSATVETTLDSLRLGKGPGIDDDPEPDLTITRPDGVVFGIAAASFKTVGEVIDAINSHPTNAEPRKVSAAMASDGNGIQITGPVGTGPIVVRQPELTNFGNALGLIPEGQDSSSSTVVAGVSRLVGDDFSPVEPQGTLDTLLRMRQAVADGDFLELERLSTRLNEDFDRASGVRGEIGFRSQTVETLKFRAQDQTTTMQARLSEEIDADFAKTISDINNKQASLEASLRVIGQSSQLTVLNFL
jgi:flagellar hook-associated protein 3 FlgL